MKQIKLSGKRGIGIFALVDDDDYDAVSKYKWHVNFKDGKIRCVRRHEYHYTDDGKKRGEMIFMHTFIIGKRDGFIIDHADRNPLNNQKNNLRYCTYSENNMNTSLYKINTSGYRGIYKHKKAELWVARISANKKRVSLGCYKNKEDAAKAYNVGAIKYHGEFARLNNV